MSVKQYYYLDSSILLEEDFYQIIEELRKSGDGVVFVLDADIYREIESYRGLGQIEEALALENLINLLATLGGAAQVSTGGGYDASALASLAEEKLFILTQRPMPVDNFSELADRVSFLHLVEGRLVPFPRGMSENGKAFCPERDIYVNPFDGEKLEYV